MSQRAGRSDETGQIIVIFAMALVAIVAMAALVIRALGEFDPPLPATQRFLDVPPTNPFFRVIDRMATLGITAGCTPTRYCPADPVTRAQLAVVLMRAFNL